MKIRAEGGSFRAGGGSFRAAGCSPLLFLFTGNTNAPTKFEVATFNGLGEDTITRNVTDGRTDRRTDGRTDRLWYEINIPYFSYEKAGINIDQLSKYTYQCTHC